MGFRARILKEFAPVVARLPQHAKNIGGFPLAGCKPNRSHSYLSKVWVTGETINVKTTVLLALGATLATAGSALAAENGAGSAVAVNVLASGPAQATAVSLETSRWSGGPGGRDCECDVPTVNVPFYTVRPPAPPVRVRAPGMRISSAPVFAPSPAIYIQGPPIYVDAPPVQVAPAQVYLEAPDVHVRPSDVSVAPPEIHFTPASPDHPDEHCCEVVSPPAHTLNVPPPAPMASAAPAPVVGSTPAPVASYPSSTTAYPAPSYTAPTATGSGYRQEPGERG